MSKLLLLLCTLVAVLAVSLAAPMWEQFDPAAMGGAFGGEVPMAEQGYDPTWDASWGLGAGK